ncbi:MAG: tRNA pseudouridine(65) synthase TruC [Myxococcales bacterium]|nr:tRNA pseudouridine(65) synthase TruC [Myxococcales bacterium]MCB9548714.1 tRNA pseudouridine(65) synthase TruC [Myxococcales bacterium]
METPSLDILYRDADCVAVHKPAGMIVHKAGLPWERPPYAVQTLRSQLRTFVQPVHRLDAGTSGVLLFAFHAEASRALMAAFARREVHKTYLAVVRGYAQDGVSDRPLIVDGVEREAHTRWRCLRRLQLAIPVRQFPTARYSLVAAWPETGRRHQVRRHLHHANHPIVGDHDHGDNRHNHLWRDHFGNQRLMLVAHRLRFPRPSDGALVEVEAPPDPVLSPLLARLGWEWPRGNLEP